MGFWEVKIDLKPILSGILSQCQHIRPHESMIGTTFKFLGCWRDIL